LKAGNNKTAIATVVCNLMRPENEAGRLLFFQDPIVQRKLVKGVIEGTLKNKKVIEQMQECQVTINSSDQDAIVNKGLDWVLDIVKRQSENAFILRFLGKTSSGALSEASQEKIANTILQGKFGDNVDVLTEVAKMMGILTSVGAQKILAQAIRQEEFGNNLTVMLEIVKHFDTFTSEEAQSELAYAIREGALSFNKDVLIEVANNLDKFTRPKAQRIIASMIYSAYVPEKPRSDWLHPAVPATHEVKRFSHDVDLILAVAGNLRAFTDTRARLNIACAISEGVFGNNVVVQTKVASHLDMFAIGIDPCNFTDNGKADGLIEKPENRKALPQKIVDDLKIQIETQEIISQAICLGRLCADEAVQRVVAQHLRIFQTDTHIGSIKAKFTNVDVVAELDKADDVLSAAFVTLGGVQLRIQANIVAAIECAEPNAKFVGKAKQDVANNFHIFTTVDIALQRRIASIVVNNYFNNFKDEPIQKFLAQIIFDGVFDPERDADMLQKVADGFGNAQVNISDNAAVYLQKALDGGRFRGIAEVTRAQLKNKLDVHQGLLAKSILDGNFDVDRPDDKVKLEAIIRSFCDATTISNVAANRLQQALSKGKLNGIEAGLKVEFEAKLKAHFAAEPWGSYLRRKMTDPVVLGAGAVVGAVVVEEYQYAILQTLGHHAYLYLMQRFMGGNNEDGNS
jgi:hypothetical protein